MDRDRDFWRKQNTLFVILVIVVISQVAAALGPLSVLNCDRSSLLSVIVVPGR